MITLSILFNSVDKEEAKQVVKEKLRKKNSIFRPASIVSNELIQINGKILSHITCNLDSFDPSITFSQVDNYLQTFSENWLWKYSSVHTGTEEIQKKIKCLSFYSISIYSDYEKHMMNLILYIFAADEKDGVNKADVIMKYSKSPYEIVGCSEYFRIDNCYEVAVRIKNVNSDINEAKKILRVFSDCWSWTELTASSNGNFYEDKIVSVICRVRKGLNRI